MPTHVESIDIALPLQFTDNSSDDPTFGTIYKALQGNFPTDPILIGIV